MKLEVEEYGKLLFAGVLAGVVLTIVSGILLKVEGAIFSATGQ